MAMEIKVEPCEMSQNENKREQEAELSKERKVEPCEKSQSENKREHETPKEIKVEPCEMSQDENKKEQEAELSKERKVEPCEKSQSDNRKEHETPKEIELSKEISNIPSEVPHNVRKIVHISRRPWITEEFMQKVQQRDELHFRVKKNPGDSALKKQFSLCRNQTAALRKKLKHAYQMYLEEL